MPTVHYLGHVLSAQGVQPDPDKVTAILDWPTPLSLTALCGFLGLTGFYRRFVRHYADLAAPLTNLLKSTFFHWHTEADVAFKQLKLSITNTPVLKLPDFTIPFELETDASFLAIGAVLSQNQHPLAFFSKKLCPRMQADFVYAREMFAITESVKKWFQFLIGRHFRIFTNQKSLKFLMSQTYHTPEQQRWATKLQGFSYDIIYDAGKNNRVADALSRCSHPTSTSLIFMAIFSTLPNPLDELRRFYSLHPAGITMKNKIQQGSVTPDLRFQFKPGLIYFKDRIFIPDHLNWCSLLCIEYHSTLY
uniref:Retrovirus-related Pol polyprotein from transposon 17.6 n=1 Tax=Cajanus cajan TaxID=3821 RepID=A0A151RMT5_CAJCA|nr:Retrovirus-related Pol polyprotein from transposon 17.6 [Cajanus cajan]